MNKGTQELRDFFEKSGIIRTEQGKEQMAGKFVGTPTYDPLRVGVSMAVKLGSIAIHAQELISPNRDQVDVAALGTLLADEEVKEWLEAMGKMAFLPVKR